MSRWVSAGGTEVEAAAEVTVREALARQSLRENFPRQTELGIATTAWESATALVKKNNGLPSAKVIVNGTTRIGFLEWALTHRPRDWQSSASQDHQRVELAAVVALIRDVAGGPFRPVALAPSWLTPTVTTLARQMYDSRDFAPMPILADALQDAGCDTAAVLDHCRGPGPHGRGCWVVDWVLGKAGGLPDFNS
jgi:hypothetical protein